MPKDTTTTAATRAARPAKATKATKATKARAPRAPRRIDLGPPRPVPPSAAPKPPVLPGLTERTLGNGLRVIAVRRPGLPLVQLRLVLPTSRPKVTPAEVARQQVLGGAFLAGTATRSATDIASELDGIGGTMAAGADIEDVSVFGSVLAPHLDAWLAVLADVVTGSTFPADEVAVERDRLLQGIKASLSSPSTVATLEMYRRYFGEHPYAERLPDPAEVEKVTSTQLRSYLRSRVGPGGGTLVVVGDVRPDAAIDAVERALGGWGGGRAAKAMPKPKVPTGGRTFLLDRPGAVQTNIRMIGPAILRTDPDLPALGIAATILGGGMSSRLFLNLREDKGYTYSPGAGIAHLRFDSAFYVVADVGADVTGAALSELRYELGRMAAHPPTPEEVEDTKSYVIGNQALSLQTMAGLATRITTLATAGLPATWLTTYTEGIKAATVEDVHRAAARFLGPGHLTTVLVGDREKILPGVAAQVPVELVDG